MLRMNGSGLGESGAPGTRRGLRTGCCRRSSVVSGGEGEGALAGRGTHRAYFGCVRDQKATHMLVDGWGFGQKEWSEMGTTAACRCRTSKEGQSL
jgi:hypothetical protein